MIKFLVTNSRTIVLVEGKKETLIKTINNKDKTDEYYGLTWSDDKVYVLRRGTNNNHQLEIFTKDLKIIETVNMSAAKLRGAHQMYFDSEDQNLYITSTVGSRITMYNIDTGKIIHHTWPTGARSHINSIYRKNNSFYVLEHSYGRATGGKDHWQSRLVQTDLEFKPIKSWKNVGRGSHNVIVQDNKAVLCSSQESKLIEKDLDTCKIIREKLLTTDEIIPTIKGDRKGWHPRGLAKGKDIWVVGLSYVEKNREIRRAQNESAIAILDLDWNVIDYINICRHQTREVRLISDLDECHNGITY